MFFKLISNGFSVLLVIFMINKFDVVFVKWFKLVKVSG